MAARVLGIQNRAVAQADSKVANAPKNKTEASSNRDTKATFQPKRFWLVPVPLILLIRVVRLRLA
jgi:hypothetical protein